MSDIKPGNRVVITDDNFANVGKVGKVTHVSDNSCVVLCEDGSSIVVAQTQVTKQQFLSEHD